MPLIVRPDCGKEFSDRAAACPSCGCPITAITAENPPTMQSNGNNLNSILLLADKAFSDNNYEEAYNSYNQAYLLEQENPHILLRLAMTTCARDASKAAVHGIPASSRQMIEKGFALLRSQAQDNSTFDGYVVNAAKDVSHIAGYLSSEA